MTALRRSPLALVLLLSLVAAGCTEEARQSAAEAKAAVAEATAEGGTIDRALDEAREKLNTENLSLGGVDGLPKAELTPQGDLLINGVAVPMTPAQREAALAYREQLLAVAESGMAMGKDGVAIAGDALALAAAGLLGADTTLREAGIEAKGKAMEAAALALCERVEGLDAAQSRFAELMPEFKPYVKAIDISADCNVAGTTDDAEVQAEEAAPEAVIST